MLIMINMYSKLKSYFVSLNNKDIKSIYKYIKSI